MLILWGGPQFLPQDRVCEFAKLTPVQLLEETEKAVGDPRLPVQHVDLISKSEELKKSERVSSFLPICGSFRKFNAKHLLVNKARCLALFFDNSNCMKIFHYLF